MWGANPCTCIGMCFCPDQDEPQPGWPPPAPAPSEPPPAAAPPPQPSARFQDDPYVRERILPPPAYPVLPRPRLDTAYFRYDPIDRAAPAAHVDEVPTYPHQV